MKALISSGSPSVPNDLRFTNSGFSRTSVDEMGETFLFDVLKWAQAISDDFHSW